MKKVAIFMVTILMTAMFAMIPASAQANLIGTMASPSDPTCQELATWRIQFLTPIKLHIGSTIDIDWVNVDATSADNVLLTDGVTSILWIEGTLVQIAVITDTTITLTVKEDVPAKQGVVVVLTKIANPDGACDLDVVVEVKDSDTGVYASAHSPVIKIKPQSLVGTIIGASVVPNALVLVDTLLYSLPATLIGNVAVIIDDVVHIVRGITNTIP